MVDKTPQWLRSTEKMGEGGRESKRKEGVKNRRIMYSNKWQSLMTTVNKAESKIKRQQWTLFK